MTFDPVRQEDWPKTQSWDVRWGYSPVKNIQDLFKALSVWDASDEKRKSKLEWFIKLPAYEPAPEQLKRQVEDFLR